MKRSIHGSNKKSTISYSVFVFTNSEVNCSPHLRICLLCLNILLNYFQIFKQIFSQAKPAKYRQRDKQVDSSHFILFITGVGLPIQRIILNQLTWSFVWHFLSPREKFSIVLCQLITETPYRVNHSRCRNIINNESLI